MQYFKPQDASLFVGDCMPFFHDGTFHVFYLLDKDHHKALGGLGGHQWAHAASPDLIRWTHYPLAITLSEEWEGSICTGSTLFARGLFYGFYATRQRERTQHISLAVSQDAVHFEKVGPNPLISPPEGYDPYHFRDPFVFWDQAGSRYHMLVTASRTEPPVAGHGGCLAHLTSQDLHAWELELPLLVPGFPDVPECPDYFSWNGWHYLIFSHEGAACYRIACAPFGPWRRPTVDLLDGGAARVMKTAPFTGDRRIGVAFVGMRNGGRDSRRLLFGGQMLLREIIQHPDGSLGTRFLPEMLPRQGDPLALCPVALTAGATATGCAIHLLAPESLEVASLAGIPRDVRITATVHPDPNAAEFGLVLKASDTLQSGYALRFMQFEQRVELLDAVLTCVDGLAARFTLEVIVTGDLIDVCIGQRRCMINRCSERSGEMLFCFARNAAVTFQDLEIRPLTET